MLEIVAWQHNEYKLIFEHAVVVGFFAMKGYILLLPLVVLGNLFVLLIGFVLWLYFREERSAFVFVPAVYLVFNLQFAETVNWATGALQNLPVVAFGLLALWLAAREGTFWLLLSSLCLVLAEASSGNGFFLLPAALPMLLRRRAWAQVAVWVLLTAIMVGLYLFGYHPMPQEPLAGAFLARALFAVMFLGGAMGDVQFAFTLGIVLCALFIHALWCGYQRTRPASFAAILFLAITAAGVAVTRGAPGLSAEIGSRYRLYSCLALIFACQYAWNSIPATRSGEHTAMSFWHLPLQLRSSLRRVRTGPDTGCLPPGRRRRLRRFTICGTVCPYPSSRGCGRSFLMHPLS